MAVSSTLVGFVVIISTWILLCRFLRTKRARFLASLDPVKDSRKVLWYMYSVEFPFLSQKGLDFVIFRSLAIPSVSRLVYQTKQIVKVPWKRADDTDILVREMIHHHVDSDRGAYALRRMNAIHSQYKIPNDQYIYVLCLFTLLPIEFSARYGYRKWTKNEELAAYTVWHDIAVRMGLEDIPQSIQDMRMFMKEYESKNFQFDQVNQTVAVNAANKLVFDPLPKLLRPLAKCGLYAFMDEHLRTSIGFPEQSQAIQWLFNRLLKLGAVLVAVLVPPRPLFLARDRIQVDWSEDPRAEPDKVMPLKIDLYNPSVYHDGYRLAELGHFKYGKVGTSHEGPLMCPFSISSLKKVD